MIVVVSGEGSGDIGGSLNGASSCGPEFFKPGPMSHFVDRFIEVELNFSVLQSQLVHWVGRIALSKAAKGKARSPKLSLPGKKSDKEMLAYRRAASALATLAMDIEKEHGDTSIAILFHDSDGTSATIEGRWERIDSAISLGFQDEGYGRGIGMVPRPKQEAWILCAVKGEPYIDCHRLEDESGNDKSLRSLKRQLSERLDGKTSTDEIVELVENGRIDPIRIDMLSLNTFRDRLAQVLRGL